MKKIIFTLIAAMALVMAGCATGPKQVDDKTAIQSDDVQNIIKRGVIRVGVRDEMPGLAYLDPETVGRSGMEIDLAYKIGAKVFSVTPEEAYNIGRVEFVTVSAAQCEDALNRDKVDMVIAGMSASKERSKKYFLSAPYITTQIGIAAKADITGVEQLKDKKVMAIADMTSAEDLKDYLSSKNVSPAGEIKVLDGAIQKSPYYSEVRNEVMKDPNAVNGTLLSDEVDAVAGDKTILAPYCQKGIHMLEGGYGEKEYVIATNKNEIGLAQIVDNTVNAMIENGEMAALRQQWGIQ